MSDDAGTSRRGPRRRTTRRLARHAARAFVDVAPLAAASGSLASAELSANALPLPSDADVGLALEPMARPVGSDAAPDSIQLSPAQDDTHELHELHELHEPNAGNGTASLAETAPEPSQGLLGVSAAAPVPPSMDTGTGSAWIAESDRPGYDAAVSGAGEPEVKTKPKIRLPEAANRRHSPRPPVPEPPAEARAASVGARLVAPPAPPVPPAPHRPMSPMPPVPGQRGASSLPPPPDPAGLVPRASAPTGEGIIRASAPAPRPNGGSGPGRPDIDSDVPTRPRIPLTHDMALAAGRLTSLDLAAVQTDDGADTRPRIFLPGEEGEDVELAPTVVVTRARMITGAPPPDAQAAAPESRRRRPSRRARPDSEEFETLDILDGEEEPSKLEATDVTSEARGPEATTGRAGRTPPPPPGQAHGKRGAAQTQARQAPPPPPPGVAKKAVPSHKTRTGKRRGWWEVLFSDDYVRTLPRPEPALVAKQVAFMEASLGISRGDAVLDVGCGLGQHALEFARRGYLVVALDLALSMITRAAEEAQQNGLRINFLHKDIRDIGFEGTFDAVVCVGTTFGFFDDEQNRGVLQRLAHALKPGGRLLLDVVNRDYVLASQPNLVWFEGDGCVVMEESDFNFYTSRLSVKRTMMREDGRQTESEYSVRLYSVHELGQLLKQAGFGIKEVSGQEVTRGLFFGSHSSRIIMLAERRASDRSPSTPPESDG